MVTAAILLHEKTLINKYPNTNQGDFQNGKINRSR